MNEMVTFSGLYIVIERLSNSESFIFHVSLKFDPAVIPMQFIIFRNGFHPRLFIQVKQRNKILSRFTLILALVTKYLMHYRIVDPISGEIFYTFFLVLLPRYFFQPVHNFRSLDTVLCLRLIASISLEIKFRERTIRVWLASR